MCRFNLYLLSTFALTPPYLLRLKEKAGVTPVASSAKQKEEHEEARKRRDLVVNAITRHLGSMERLQHLCLQKGSFTKTDKAAVDRLLSDTVRHIPDHLRRICKLVTEAAGWSSLEVILKYGGRAGPTGLPMWDTTRQ